MTPAAGLDAAGPLKRGATCMKSVLAVLFLTSTSLCAQGVKVVLSGKSIGARSTLNLESGIGIIESCKDDGATKDQVTCTASFNSALLSSHDSVHNNENYCVSTSGSTQFTCRLPYKVITGYQAGMTFVLVANATCSHACSLNIDGLGPVGIKKSDGSTDPEGTLVSGEPQWVFYDGKVFRLMGGGTRRAGEDSDRERDAMARRFIASMETLPYASTVTLETTAGDIHKTTTSNAVGNATIRAATAGLAGQHMWIIILNDQLSPKTITFGEHLRSAGTLTGTPGKAATVQFISDGTVWYEVARTTNL
jgi:hypothetical protein